MDEKLTQDAAEKQDQVKRVPLSFTGGHKNWGWSRWEAEVDLDELHQLTGGATKGQLVAVAKAST
jgi:hypothetical protein